MEKTIKTLLFCGILVTSFGNSYGMSGDKPLREMGVKTYKDLQREFGNMGPRKDVYKNVPGAVQRRRRTMPKRKEKLVKVVPTGCPGLLLERPMTPREIEASRRRTANYNQYVQSLPVVKEEGFYSRLKWTLFKIGLGVAIGVLGIQALRHPKVSSAVIGACVNAAKETARAVYFGSKYVASRIWLHIAG